MSKMSKIFFVLAVLGWFVPVSTFSAETAEGEVDDPTASYEKAYLSPLETVCGTAFRPEKTLIRQAFFLYPRIGDPAMEKQYREMVKGVGWDASRLQELFSADLPVTETKIESVVPFKIRNDIEAASEVYKERMNATFACAQIQYKIRVHEKLVKTVQGEKADAGNMVKKIEEQTRMLKKESAKRGCVDLSNTEGANNVYLKKTLLDNAFYQYCDYRHYLQYLKTNVSTRLSKFYESEKKRSPDTVTNPDAKEPSLSVEKVANGILSSMSKIDVEIAHTREVFPQSMVAYAEFERTYASHVVLLMITEDYRLIRESLKKIMNPLGQVIYKASNAQSPFSR